MAKMNVLKYEKELAGVGKGNPNCLSCEVGVLEDRTFSEDRMDFPCSFCPACGWWG